MREVMSLPCPVCKTSLRAGQQVCSPRCRSRRWRLAQRRLREAAQAREHAELDAAWAESAVLRAALWDARGALEHQHEQAAQALARLERITRIGSAAPSERRAIPP